jgi:hypothetical protein
MKKVWSLLAALLLTGCMGWVPGQQAYWDAQVKEMCEKDGGAQVYERVDLSSEDYQRLGGTNGVIPVPLEGPERVSPYFARTTIVKIHDGSPEVTKRTTDIVRRSDGKILGRNIIYSRVGGDFPTVISHHSYFACTDMPSVRTDIERQIFVVRERSK